MRVFKVRLFARFARRESIADASLIEASDRAGRGLVDADLGAGLIKQRVARQGQGRRGGYRVLLAFRAQDRVVFLFGFAKNDRENLDDAELAAVRVVAESWLTATPAQLTKAVKEGLLIEVDS